MAKIIRDQSGNFLYYQSGVIYNLVMEINDTKIPFYVGETHNPEQRLRDHQSAGKNADEESTLVYRTIKELTKQGISWSMEILTKYGKEGPTDLEDEWIMSHLVDGHKLTNMKKGNANWLEERQQVAGDMRRRGINSYRKYCAVVTQEDADRKHAKWLEEQKEKDQHAENRKRIAEETARIQEEIIRQKAIAKEQEAQRRLREQAAWEADKPAREARLKAQTEKMLAAERQKELDKEQARRAKQKLQEQQDQSLLERANINYAEWPNQEDRIRHQRSEDIEIQLMATQGMSEEKIKFYIERDRKMHWSPLRART